MKKFCLSILFSFICVLALAQVDRSELRSGNRKFKKGEYKESEIDYRRALVKDSLSLKANYNLASSLYRQDNFQEAGEVLSKVNSESSPSEVHYNAGNVALKNKDYATAVKEFRSALLQTPDDLDAKENYIYAKKMLENQQNQNQDQQDNQDQNQDEQQNQNQNQNQDQQQNEDNQDQNQPQAKDEELTDQQAQQLLNAMLANEKKVQDEIDKKKAEELKAAQKEKNW